MFSRSMLLAAIATISLTVFPAATSDAAGKKKPKQAGFKAYDINNDLRLSPAEYRTMAETKPKKYTGRFELVDTNRDGFISIEEYRQSFAKPKTKKKK